jgi:uncharacterized protein YraI
MSFWKQIPGTTRVYLIILIYLFIMLLILIFTRLTLTSTNDLSLSSLFTRKGARETATAVSDLSLTTTAQTIPNFSPDKPWLRTSQVVKILTGPGAEYSTIAIMESNQVAEIAGVSPDRRWWAIKIPYVESGVGWVPDEQVFVENAEQVAELIIGQATPTVKKPIDEVPNVRAYANVNVRSGPDMFFSKIGLLKSGESAEVAGISQDGMWWAIKLPGKEDAVGWVAKDYVIPSNTEDVPVMKLGGVSLNNIPPTPAPDAPSLTALYPVNIRAGPGVEYAVVSQLEQGQIAEVVGVNLDGLWIAVKLLSQQNGRGWVASAYVKLANASDVPILK